MSELSRRGFFRLAAGAAIAPVLARAGIAAPTLWGDGLHDDTVALKALFNGDVVEFAYPDMARGAGWEGKTLRLPHGVFRMTEPLVLDATGKFPAGVSVDGAGSTFALEGNHEFCIEIRNTKGCALYNLRFLDPTVRMTRPLERYMRAAAAKRAEGQDNGQGQRNTGAGAQTGEKAQLADNRADEIKQAEKAGRTPATGIGGRAYDTHTGNTRPADGA